MEEVSGDVRMVHHKHGVKMMPPGFANSSHATRQGWRREDVERAEDSAGEVIAKINVSPYVEMLEKFEADLKTVTDERDALKAELAKVTEDRDHLLENSTSLLKWSDVRPEAEAPTSQQTSDPLEEYKPSASAKSKPGPKPKKK